MADSYYTLRAILNTMEKQKDIVTQSLALIIVTKLPRLTWEGSWKVMHVLLPLLLALADQRKKGKGRSTMK